VSGGGMLQYVAVPGQLHPGARDGNLRFGLATHSGRHLPVSLLRASNRTLDMRYYHMTFTRSAMVEEHMKECF
jgi:hypothetical protein